MDYQKLETIILKAQVSALTHCVNEIAQLINSDDDICQNWKRRMWAAVEKLQYAGMEEMQKHETQRVPEYDEELKAAQKYIDELKIRAEYAESKLRGPMIGCLYEPIRNNYP